VFLTNNEETLMINAVIDISHHNTVTSFQQIKENGIIGVIHKATQGRTLTDAKYHNRRQRALDAGLLWGAYHFAVRGNVEQQVDHFLETVNPQDTDLLVLDFEPNGESGTMTRAEAEAFVTLVNDKVGRFPGLYSGQAFIREKVGSNTTTVLKNCFLWIARYSSQQPLIPAAWPRYTFWQYTDGGFGPQPHQVPGVGRCDRNKFNGDEAGLRRLWGVSE
jgi:lysozyme